MKNKRAYDSERIITPKTMNMIDERVIQVAYRAGKAFRATGSMEWMYQTGMEEGVLIFGACNAT